jgi:hypothetical protein
VVVLRSDVGDVHTSRFLRSRLRPTALRDDRAARGRPEGGLGLSEREARGRTE